MDLGEIFLVDSFWDNDDVVQCLGVMSVIVWI